MGSKRVQLNPEACPQRPGALDKPLLFECMFLGDDGLRRIGSIPLSIVGGWLSRGQSGLTHIRVMNESEIP